MTEDHELDNWREQWSSVAAAPSDFQRRVRLRIKRQNLRFVLGNLLTAIAFVGMLMFAVAMREQSKSLGSGWMTAICVLVVVSVANRVWILRGTWRSQAHTTRAHMELWRRRVQARIQLLKIALYLSGGWILCCAALMAANWTTIRIDVRAHPNEWLWGLAACVLMQPVILLGAALLWRRKLAELREVDQIMGEMSDE
jgi:hypothetical protein